MKHSFTNPITRILICTALVALMCTVFACAYTVVRPNEGNYFICASDNTGYCLDVTSGSTQTGAYIQLWQRTSGNAAQIFKIQRYSGNWYRIVNANTGHVLNVPGANYVNGQQLWMWDNSDYTNASLWRFLDAGNGKYLIQNKLGKTIDLDNNLIFSGSRVHLWDQHGGASCRWKLVSASSSNSSSSLRDFSSVRSNISEGTYKITLHDNTSLCLNVIYKSTASLKATVGVDHYNGESNERFVVKNRGNGYYSIHPVHASYMCLNAKNANKNPGDALTLYEYENGDAASLWSFHKYNGEGSYAIMNKATGLVCDITNGDYSIGNLAIHWTANNYKRAQAYYLTRLSSDTTIKPKASWTAPMTGYTTTQSFGNKGHLGIDIKASNRTVYAAYDGVVYKTGCNGTWMDAYDLKPEDRSGNGYYVVIKHNVDGKTVYTMYGHLKRHSTLVSEGQTVKSGQPIATMGNTGNSTAPHLHFAIVNNPSNGAYYGYTASRKTFSANIQSRGNYTYYNPAYVLKYNKLP